MGSSQLHRRQILWSAVGGLVVAFIAMAALHTATDVRHRVRIALNRADLANVVTTWDAVNQTVRLEGEVARGSDRLRAEQVVSKVAVGDVTIANRLTVKDFRKPSPKDDPVISSRRNDDEEVYCRILLCLALGFGTVGVPPRPGSMILLTRRQRSPS